MIFVDSNVFMYAVGRPHALRTPSLLRRSQPEWQAAVHFSRGRRNWHTHRPTGRLQTFDAALALMARAAVEVWPLEEADVALARRLHEQYPALQARDLCHLAGCRRRGVKQIKTFDQTFAAVSGHQSIS